MLVRFRSRSDLLPVGRSFQGLQEGPQAALRRVSDARSGAGVATRRTGIFASLFRALKRPATGTGSLRDQET